MGDGGIVTHLPSTRHQPPPRPAFSRAFLWPWAAPATTIGVELALWLPWRRRYSRKPFQGGFRARSDVFRSDNFPKCSS